jgi:coenzyme F420 biosynthesis associated uncharacterized protein
VSGGPAAGDRGGPGDARRTPGPSSGPSSGRASGGGPVRSRGQNVLVGAGFLAGAALGAAITVLGKRAERSARRGLIDWRGAERFAADRVRNAPGTLDRHELERAAPIYAAAMAEIVPALSRALETQLPGIVERSGVASREEWVHANVATFARLMAGVDRDLVERAVPSGSGLVKAGMAIANRMVTTRQIGYLLGFMGQRVLGQYDVALISAEATPGRLLFVDENIRRTAAILDVPLNPFRTWIALHETTHAFEFEAHPWLRPYLSERLERQLASLTSGASAMNRDAVGRLGRALRNASMGESWMEGLMTTTQRREFREIQAVMSLLEGFGDYMMDEVGRDLVPDVELISSRFHSRRQNRTGFERAMMRLTGMDMKMEQYRKGEEFVAAIARAGGSTALRMLWHGPESLPLPEEIETPSRWLARVLPTS